MLVCQKSKALSRTSPLNCLCILSHSVYYSLRIVLLSFVLAMLKWWVPALAIQSRYCVYLVLMVFTLSSCGLINWINKSINSPRGSANVGTLWDRTICSRLFWLWETKIGWALLSREASSCGAEVTL